MFKYLGRGIGKARNGMTSMGQSGIIEQMIAGSSLFCNLSAMDHDQRKRYDVLVKDILSRYLELKELPDGYAMRFPNETVLFTELSEWATLERLCCPFLTLTLEPQHDQGTIWLKLTGKDGVKDFLRAEIGI